MKSDFVSRLQHGLLLAAILLFGTQLATEITALKLNFQSGLGKPLIAWLHVYNPCDFFLWTINYWNVPRVHSYLMPGSYIFFSVLTLVVILAILHNIRESQQKEVVTTHGSARFASLLEIEDSGLLNNRDPLAVYVGGLQQGNNKIHYLRDSSPTHVFAYAPSRSGKGVGLIVPTLLMYQGSVIVSDFKLENWQLTAGARQAMGHTTLKFDPTCADETAAGFNPLMEIRLGDFEVRDTQLVADMIIDQGGDTKKKNSHWDNSANSLLVSAILHVLYAEPDKSLAGVRNFLSNVSRSEQETLYHMLKSIHDPEKKYQWHDPATAQATLTHPVIALGAREMLNKSEPERTGIFSTALTALKLYRDPIIAKNTSDHDFTIDSLVNHEKPVSLYLGIPPSDIERTMPLMRLILQQILSRLTEQLDAENGMAKRRQLH